ncbi:MAG: baseplate J/gp47 family protein [Lewinellaceae bacterium]|nr:baseplate J/gp47 family protein [Lewinellaceae bacterium]
MSENSRHEHPLQHSGQSQTQRLPRALDPAFFRVDERSVEDLLRFSYNYAADLEYFSADNRVTGNWQGFLENSQGKTLAELEAMPDTEPHFALFLCFLHLFGYAQERLNTLTQRHLEYYYEKVLQIRRRKPQPDQVHLVFELAKNATEVLLPKGTRLNAGKDDTGKPLYYQLTEDSVLNRAKIEHLRTVLFENGKLHVASQANTADGQGEPPAAQPFSWPAMGSSSHPTAPVGMAVAAPILRLSGGERTIRLLFTLDRIVPALDSAADAMQVFATGEKGWIGPLSASGGKVRTNSGSTIWPVEVQTLTNSMEAIVPYDPEIHAGNFNTHEPLLRILFEPEKAAPYLEALGNLQVEALALEVEVDNFKNVELLSSEGPLDPKRSFAPFGDKQPHSGSQFFIDSEEVFSKPLQQIKLNLHWQNAPKSTSTGIGSVAGLGFGMEKIPLAIVKNDSDDDQYAADIRVISGNLSGSYTPVHLFQADSGSSDPLKQTITIPPAPQIAVLIKPYFQVKTPLVAAPKTYLPLAVKTGQLALTISANTKLVRLADSYQLITKVIETFFLEKSPFDGIRLTLQIKNQTAQNASFKPQLSDFSLSYKAATATEPLRNGSDALTKFRKRSVQFFHIDAFGQCETHGVLMRNNASAVRLLPAPEAQGNLYLGFQNLQPRQTLNLFFQLLEGSANPEKAVEKVSWSVLAGNAWLPLEAEHLLADRTNGLLTSNLIRLMIPSAASTDNTLMEPGFIWLRATVQNNPDAICRILDVQAQGLTARFADAGNSPNHLVQALAPGTISKLTIQDARVKKVAQPYASFGGRPQEQDTNFYTRVAERLRHKQRAVSIWDYERLVLEQFPEVFQVKCISHCAPDSEVAPGHVTLVVIPDYRHYTADNPLEPRVSLYLLDAIRQWILPFKMPGVIDVHVQNPLYEQLFLDFKVAFREENKLDFGILRQQLNADINRMLSPWANANQNLVTFNGRYFRSALIYALEQLEYIDYVSHFNMFRLQANGKRSEPLEEAAPTQARALLVPAPEHNIQNAKPV